MTNPLEILPKPFTDALEQTGAVLRPNHAYKTDALTQVGQGNLRELVKVLRSNEKSLSQRIGYMQRRLELFHRRSPKYFDQQADHAVDVTTLNAGMYPYSKTRLGVKSLDYGHSTFVRCGSCRHFSYKGKFVRCSILGEFDSEQGVPYDTDCLIRAMSVKELGALSRQYLKGIQTLKCHRNIVRRQIKRTRLLINTSEQLPILPDYPFADGRMKLKYGDRVRVFVFSPCCRKADRNQWQPATVLHSRHDCVVCFDHPIMTNRGRDARTKQRVVWPKHIWFHNSSQYIVLLEWEYQKLREMYRTNPDDPFLETWKGNFQHGSWRPYDSLSDSYPELQMQDMVDELFTGKKVLSLGPDKRLMGADEAIAVLGYRPSEKATSDDIVEAYYQKYYKDDADVSELKRAKDTLLLRLYGSESAWG